MIVYRLINEKYKGNLTGTGAYINGGRWNYVEQYMLYSAEHISLALVEIMVHQNHIVSNSYLQTLELPIAKNCYRKIDLSDMPENWQFKINETQKLGSAFLKNEHLLYCVVPSIIVKQENNILINPTSNLIKQVKLISEVKFDIDKRLLNK